MNNCNRFGGYVGGDPEQPYTPDFCVECDKPYCSGECLKKKQIWDKRQRAIERIEKIV